MGFYDNWVLPRLLNLMMGNKPATEERKKALAEVTGTVLEVGFGAGHNLPWYPPGVRRLVAVDPSRQSAKLARKRIAQAPFPVEYIPVGAEVIPAPDRSFDCVVSTFSLCTIPNPVAALEQMRRVLKPGGKLFLAEHGLTPDPAVQRWQHRMNGLHNVICGGCNTNRDIRRLVAEAGFEFDHVEQYYMKGAPKFAGFITRGIARAASHHVLRGAPGETIADNASLARSTSSSVL
jgi:ubiquinone/menaquinone biosynthesis C-methylase UbiE